MRALQRQFFFTFGVMGSVLAYLPLFLDARLGSMSQVGLVMSTTGLAVILTPVIMTALADTKLQSRTLIAVMFAVSSVACFWQSASHSFVGLFVSHAVFAFAIWPITSLQDGLVFAEARQAEGAGRAATPYHRVRVFGTIGFAIPLGLLYLLLRDTPVLAFLPTVDVGVALVLGGVVCALGAVNALTLPHVALGQARLARYSRSVESSDGQAGGQAGGRARAAVKRGVPTFAAARVLFSGAGVVFCVCLFLAHCGNSAYYAFYPLYLTQTVGFDERWVGPITMLGVVLELGVMTSVGLMSAKLGLKWLLVAGLSVMALRFALLGLWPVQHVAVWTQVLHGITVVAIYVVPPIYLNALAGDHFRSSIQGLYAMTVFGPSRIVGNIVGGELSDIDLPLMFNLIAATTLLAVIGLAVGMRPPAADGGEDTDPRDVPPMVEGD